MIKIHFKDKAGVVWFPITEDYWADLEKGAYKLFVLGNTLHEVYKQIHMTIVNVGSNYVVATYTEDTFRDLPDGEYVLSSPTGHNHIHEQWLLHIGAYYTQSPLKDVKTIKKDEHEIKSFV